MYLQTVGMGWHWYAQTQAYSIKALSCLKPLVKLLIIVNNNNESNIIAKKKQIVNEKNKLGC